jgi:hypothetical protein
MTDDMMTDAGETTGAVVPTGAARSGLVLIALILVAAGAASLTETAPTGSAG